jgi:hypothetical protein
MRQALEGNTQLIALAHLRRLNKLKNARRRLLRCRIADALATQKPAADDALEVGRR